MIETRGDLGEALTQLRNRAGLTIRELAVRCDLPAATVGDYMTGRHLPGPAQADQFRKVLRTCGVTDPVELTGWQDTVDRLRAATDGRQARRVPPGSPYRGLRPFEAEDAGLFFGRERFLAQLLARLTELRAARDGTRLLFLIGASGSGKSSLLRAGVQPAVARGALGPDEAWSVTILVPGSDPAAALDQARSAAGEPRLIIVDQFEELYTLAEPGSAAAFVAALATLGPDTLVLGGMRADFFPSAAADPSLLPALQKWQMVVPPLTEPELRSAIVDPAAARQVEVDEALVEVALADVFPSRRPGATGYQNALPLLSHALLAAWGRLDRGRRLTLAHYREAGGLHGAVQKSAEQAYAELGDGERTLVRRLFLRLVTIDDDYVITKRRITRAELPAGDVPVEPVIERFVNRRLITVDEQHIEISHDALLTAWPRLAGWIAADHDGLALHRRLTGAANDWHEHRSDDLLLRGSLLALTVDWARDPDHQASMNALERAYLDRSSTAREAEKRVARRRIKVLRRLVAALVVLVVVSFGSAGYAFRAGRSATHARDEALSRQVAIESARARDLDPALAEQLALVAYRISPTLDARSALLDATSDGVVHRLAGSAGPTLIRINPAGTVMAVSDAVSGAVVLRRYAGDRPGDRLAVVPGDAGKAVFALAFSPDGNTLAFGGEAGRVRLVDVRDPARPAARAVAPGTFGKAVESIDFSADGSRLVAAGADPPVRVWNATAGGWQPAGPVGLADGAEVMQTVAFGPGGGILAAGGSDGSLRLWPVGRLDRPPASIAVGRTALTTGVWSPDGRTLLAGAKDGSATIVDVTARRIRQRLDTGFTSWVNAAAFGDGRIAVGGSNNQIAVFDGATYLRQTTIASAAQVTSLAYAKDGAVLHAAAADGVVRGFPVRSRTIDTGLGPIFAIGVNRAGDRIALSSSGARGETVRWAVTGPAPLRVPGPARPAWFGAAAGSVALSPDGAMLVTANRAGTLLLEAGDRQVRLDGATKLVEAVQFSPDARLVAAGSDDGLVHLWDVSAPAAPRRLTPLDSGGEAVSVAFSPNGRYLAAASVDHRVHLWDIGSPSAARALPSLTGFAGYAWSVAFAPDSRTLAAGGADDTIRLWDIADPRKARPLGTALTGPTHYVSGIAFRPDGQELAAAGGDGSVWTWRLAGRSAPRPETALHAANPGGKTYAIAYAPDGRSLYAVGTSGQVTRWRTDERETASALCESGGDGLTRAEWSQYVPGAPYRAACPG